MNPSSNKKRKRKTKKKSNAGTQEQVSKHKGPSVEEVAEQAMRKKQKQLLELEKRQRRKASKGEKGGTQESKRSTAESEEHLAQNAVGEDEEEDAVVEDEIVDVNAEEDEEVVEGDELAVEGVVCNGKLFLVDKRRSIVYASERDAEEQLVRVGAWDPLKREPVPDVTEAGLAPALYPFTVDPADHCESPVESFEHIAGLLGEVSKLVKKPRVDLKIYDPFFCAGSVIAHLATCGFPTVYNRCEDFYEVQREGKGPDFDVIVTNPPYSGEHVEKIVEFCQASGKPWFLLLPNYFVNKPWYTALEAASRFYVVPRKRYLYRAPKGARLKGDVRKDRKTSPFTTFWCLFTIPAPYFCLITSPLLHHYAESL
jgi:hypothetical protein